MDDIDWLAERIENLISDARNGHGDSIEPAYEASQIRKYVREEA